MQQSARLIVNADDFGFTHDVNEGILESHLHGIVRSTSLMSNGAAFEDAVHLAKENEQLDVGCHLMLVQGESVSCPGSPLAPTLLKFLTQMPSREFLLQEFRAQIERLLVFGIHPSHLDTHKHVHVIPRVLEAVLTVADEYGIQWIRRPFDMPFGVLQGWKRTCLSIAMHSFAIAFDKSMNKAASSTTDYFTGFALTGALHKQNLLELLAQLPQGVGEFVCHPGICGDELSQAKTTLKQSRKMELDALCSPELKELITAQGIEIASFRDLE